MGLLERTLWRCDDDPLLSSLRPVTERMRRARHAVESRGCYSSSWKWVPPNYYDLTLEERRDVLGAVDTSQLCKSMLMENRSSSNNDCSDRTDARFYLVVVQYDASIDAGRLGSEVRALRPPGPDRLAPSKFDFRVADGKDNTRLTGYDTGAVTPFGLKDSTIPVVLARDVMKLEPRFMWMGGGHVNLKLGMAVDEFVRGTDAIVAEVSVPRSGRTKE